MKAILIALSAIVIITSTHAISITTDSFSYSQNFDGLASSGTSVAWANDSTLPGWYLFSKSAAAVSAYAAGKGSDTGGSFYSFGADSSTERALGGVGSGGAYFDSPASGAVAGWIAVAFKNNSGSALDSFAAYWTGEQWRNGGTTSAQTMAFQYGFGDTFTAVTTWETPAGIFNWASPIHTSPAGALDGNGMANRVTGVGGDKDVTWADGDTLWLRWIELNDSGNDHGLAIDDFTFSAKGTPTPTPDSGSTVLYFVIPLLGLLVIQRRGPQPV